MVVVESAGITDIGRKRKGNEDSYFLDDRIGVYVVADGMGGHQAGEVASRLVVETMKDYMNRIRENEDAEELADIDKSLSRDANRLIASIHLSNQIVYRTSQDKVSFQGMGSTVSAVYFTNDTVIATNVGDSPIYLIRNKHIETLSMPHTVLAEQMAIDPEAGRQFGERFSHMLTRAMGIEKEVMPDICELQCFKDDKLVIASDGLTDKLSPEEILEIADSRKPDETCQILVDMANERGGDDNITIIVINVEMVKYEKTGIMGLISRIFRKK